MLSDPLFTWKELLHRLLGISCLMFGFLGLCFDVFILDGGGGRWREREKWERWERWERW